MKVPFSTKLRASWGVLDSSSFAGVTTSHDGNNALLTWTDIFCVDPVPAIVNVGGGCAVNRAKFVNTAHLTPMVTTGATFASLAAPPPATGNGFILYLTGKFYLMQMAALPTAGTIWHARYPAGNITGTSGSYAFAEATNRPAAVPGLSVAISYKGSSPVDLAHTTAGQLASVHTVPDPYYVTNALEITPNNKVLKFVNLPGQCIVRIYSVSGILVQVLTHNDPTGGGELAWDLRNRSNQFVASGVYFYHVEAADGETKVGRLTVVQFAP